MASTKTLYTLISPGTLNAAGSTTVGTVASTNTGYGGAVTIKISNTSSNPTVACQAHVLAGASSNAMKTIATYFGDTVTSSINEFACDINPGFQLVNIQFDSNTVQSVSTEAYFHELTTV